MHKILAFFLLCVAACSIDSGTAPDAGMMLASDGGTTDGARVIVPQFRVGSAMLMQPIFFDRMLNTPCYPRKTTAGLRCLPTDVNLIVYADAGCTQLAGLGVSCQDIQLGTVADRPADVCDQGNYHTYKLKKLTQNTYYTKGGLCIAFGVPTGKALYAADTEIDPTTFAEAVEVR